MTAMQLIFLVTAAVTIFAGVMMVSVRKLLHAALWLILVLFGVAVIFGLLETSFMTIVQVVVYIGAIAILVVFAIMLSRKVAARDLVQRNGQWLVSAIVAVLMFGVMVYMTLQTAWPVVKQALKVDSIGGLGEAFVGAYALPFEVVSIVLLVALVGAIIIAREK